MHIKLDNVRLGILYQRPHTAHSNPQTLLLFRHCLSLLTLVAAGKDL